MTVRKTKSRWPSRPLNGRSSAPMPPHDHPAIKLGHTIYKASVLTPSRDPSGPNVLKPGSNNRKIGGVILKGGWKGMRVYLLSLEERKTCPRSCLQWRSCYGNVMPFAERFEAGPDLMWRLEREIAWLDFENPGGFVIRLHLLGDFFSVAYVKFWRLMFERHPALRIYGYTARWNVTNDPIAAELALLARDIGWERLAMRFSDAPYPTRSTVVVSLPEKAPHDSIVCPEQTGKKTESCSTCTLCWSTEKRIAFIQH